MKKIIHIIMILFLFFHSCAPLFAHPLDISVSTVYIKNNYAHITTYFHSYEIEYLLKKNNINPDGVNDYYDNNNIIIDYLSKNIVLKNNQKICIINNIELISDETYKILTDGLGVTYTAECEKNIENLDLQINFFIEFPLQTNRVTVFLLGQGLQSTKALLFKVLTSKITSFQLNVLSTEIIKATDSDNDGLSDEEEKIYNTDPKNIDTDGDFFTDKEEVEYGWNPTNKELGPGQEYRDALQVDQLEEIKNIEKSTIDELNETLKNQKLSDYGYGNKSLTRTMKYINDYFEHNTGNIFYVFLIVFFLGILHAAGPGHSKSLLVSYTIEKQNGYLKGFLFAFIFTVTHIIDIILLFFITKFIVSFVDTSQFSYYIQLISAIILFFLSLFLIYKAYTSKSCEHSNNKSIFIAFIAGLAPCSFAWSIFLLLIALGKSSWIIPLIIALGLGIFTTLCGVVVLSVYLKNKIYSKVGTFSKYSSYISAGIIMIISMYLLNSIL